MIVHCNLFGPCKQPSFAGHLNTVASAQDPDTAAAAHESDTLASEYAYNSRNIRSLTRKDGIWQPDAGAAFHLSAHLGRRARAPGKRIQLTGPWIIRLTSPGDRRRDALHPGHVPWRMVRSKPYPMYRSNIFRNIILKLTLFPPSRKYGHTLLLRGGRRKLDPCQLQRT